MERKGDSWKLTLLVAVALGAVLLALILHGGGRIVGRGNRPVEVVQLTKFGPDKVLKENFYQTKRFIPVS